MRRPLLFAALASIAGGACSGAQPVATGDVPPRPIDASGGERGAVETFAIDSIFLGDVDRNGAPSNVAWKRYGYDLDGLVTTKDSTNVCGLVTGAPKSNQTDGNGGIDNVAGSVLVPILETAELEPTPSATETSAIRGGAWTLQIELDGFGSASNVVGIDAQVFTSALFDDGMPAFDESTNWPILASSVRDGANVASGALVQLADAYVTADGTFVSGVASDEPIVVPLPFPRAPKRPIVLRIHRAIITFERDASDPTRLVNGTIAGVLETEEFVDAVRVHAQANNSSYCGDAFDGIADQLRQAQDILRDETNAPGLVCDAISIGIGFTARQVASPTRVVADPPVTPSPCATDAGALDGGAPDATPDAPNSD